jgi:hypothetical protein
VDWQDQLADRVRELEEAAQSYDPALATKALQMLLVLRGYEARVRQLALRSDHRLAGNL